MISSHLNSVTANQIIITKIILVLIDFNSTKQTMIWVGPVVIAVKNQAKIKVVFKESQVKIPPINKVVRFVKRAKKQANGKMLLNKVTRTFTFKRKIVQIMYD